MEEKVIHPSMQRIYSVIGLQGSDLAHAINESPQTIYNWEKRGISKTGAFIVSDKYKIDLKWILSGESDTKIDNVVKNVNTIEHSITTSQIPIKSYGKIDQDGFYTEIEYKDNGFIALPTFGKNAYAIKVPDDSMYPAVRSGWYLVCDPSSTLAITEFVEVKFKNGQRIIKEFLGIVGDLLHLLSVSGNKRMTFEMNDIEEIIAITYIVPPSKYQKNPKHTR